MNQRIVYINREEDVIIVQNKGSNEVYQDTLENFETDYGTAVPGYINSLDYCIETDLKILNGSRIGDDTANGTEAIAYANSLIPQAGTLFDTQYARMNPPKPEPEEPVLTPEEEQKLALEETIYEAQDFLDKTDYRVIKFMDKYIEEHPEVKSEFDAEYPDTLTQRQAARDTINTAQAQVASLEPAAEEA